MIHWVRLPLTCVVPVHLGLRSKTDDELVPTTVVCEPSNEIFPSSVGLDFWRVPLVRHSHILIIVVKHVHDKDMRSVQLVAVCLLTGSLCLLQPPTNKKSLQSKLPINSRQHNSYQIFMIKQQATSPRLNTRSA
jgi:hypothetical protein